MRCSPSHRWMNFESGERRSPSQPSCGEQMDVTKSEAKEEGERALLVSKKTTSKAEQLQHLSSRTSRPSPSRKKKWEK
eukprot:12528928-Ditylum_brightwellii.AAC.1